MSRRPGNSSQPATTIAPANPFAWSNVRVGAAIILLTLVAYLPALHAGFIWDDDGHITRADLRDLSGLLRIWFEFGATQQYYPVLHSAFWLEHLVWGDSPLGYHLLNVLLHASAACLFCTLLRRLAVPGAALAALLFALHPSPGFPSKKTPSRSCSISAPPSHISASPNDAGAAFIFSPPDCSCWPC